jgi:plasmid stabilization system protein ParE
MTYQVIMQRLALADLQEGYDWAARVAPHQAEKWLERFQAALQGLDMNPQRCPLAREGSKVSMELREYLFGKRPNVYRAIFAVDGSTVRILRIRRAQRRFLTRQEIEDAFRADS